MLSEDHSVISRRIRSPFDQIAGCVWLARLADKTRLMSRGELPSDYVSMLGNARGIDGFFLTHFGFDCALTLRVLSGQPDDSGVAVWFLAQPTVTSASLASWNQLAIRLGMPGHPGESGMAMILERYFEEPYTHYAGKSFFELILLDEGFVPAAAPNQPGAK